jgi:hypothetical protein
MPMFKVKISIENEKKLKEIAKTTYGDDSDFCISILLNRYLSGLN